MQYEEHHYKLRKQYRRKGFQDGLKEMETNPTATPKIQKVSSEEEKAPGAAKGKKRRSQNAAMFLPRRKFTSRVFFFGKFLFFSLFETYNPSLKF